MPDSTLENEWNEFKVLQLTDTKLSVREKQLIGYAVALPCTVRTAPTFTRA